MRRRILAAISCGLFLGAGVVLTQQQMADVQLKTEHVRGNIHMINGTGGNIGVSVGEDGILIVDSKFAPLADKIRAAVAALNKGPLKFILNTHYHGDHTGANAALGREAPIIAHTNVRKRLKEGVPARNTPPAAKEAWPVITFDHSVSVHFNGEEIKVIHFPRGHTDGDSIIFFTGSNVVHMGDDFFAGRFPFVDIDGGGDPEGLANVIAAAIQQIPADAKIIPGHGPISTLDDLKAYHAMMTETIGVVRQKMRAGKSLDQIKQEGLPEKYKSWGWQFINEARWIDIIHRGLSGSASPRGQLHVPPGRDGHGHPHPH